MLIKDMDYDPWLIESSLFDICGTQLSIINLRNPSPEVICNIEKSVYIDRSGNAVQLHDFDVIFYFPINHEIRYRCIFDISIAHSELDVNAWQVITSILEEELSSSKSCINPPVASLSVSNKFSFYKNAILFGMSVPEFLLTNSVEAASEFVERKGQAIGKVCSSHKLNEDGTFYNASKLTPEIIREGEKELAESPIIIQDIISKKEEYRTFVFSGSAITCSIEVPPSDFLDPRLSKTLDASISSENVMTTAVERDLVNFCRYHNLSYCCFDWAPTPCGWAVFDANPHGTWDWFTQSIQDEIQTGFVKFLRDTVRIMP